jgi:hypothetical protein
MESASELELEKSDEYNKVSCIAAVSFLRSYI